MQIYFFVNNFNTEIQEEPTVIYIIVFDMIFLRNELDPEVAQ